MKQTDRKELGIAWIAQFLSFTQFHITQIPASSSSTYETQIIIFLKSSSTITNFSFTILMLFLLKDLPASDCIKRYCCEGGGWYMGGCVGGCHNLLRSVGMSYQAMLVGNSEIHFKSSTLFSIILSYV